MEKVFEVIFTLMVLRLPCGPGVKDQEVLNFKMRALVSLIRAISVP